MDNIKIITDFISQRGKSAADMAATLKSIGDGDMSTGIVNIANYCAIEGMIKGAVGTAIIMTLVWRGGKYIKSKYKNHQEAGTVIIKSLEEKPIVQEDEVINSGER